MIREQCSKRVNNLGALMRSTSVTAKLVSAATWACKLVGRGAKKIMLLAYNAATMLIYAICTDFLVATFFCIYVIT